MIGLPEIIFNTRFEHFNNSNFVNIEKTFKVSKQLSKKYTVINVFVCIA